MIAAITAIRESLQFCVSIPILLFIEPDRALPPSRRYE
jgi:hypothetical protein